MIAAGTQLPLRELMTVSGDEVGSEHHAQARSVAFWLLGRGNRGVVKGAMAVYLKSLEDIIKEEDKVFEEAESIRMQTEMRASAEAGADTPEKTDEELEAELTVASQAENR